MPGGPDDRGWQNNLQELKRYMKENGHCRVPLAYTSDCGTNLGQWVFSQRKRPLCQDRIDALNSIGFSWNPYEEDWEEKFEMLQQYKEEHGNCLVPARHEILGSWVRTQRQSYKKDNFSDERMAKLNSIGFVWDIGVRDQQDAAWQEKFESLKKCKEENGKCLVTQKHEMLGSWVNSQRQLYKNNRLPNDRIVQLNSIGFCWSIYDEDWQEKFDLLKCYKEEHGNCLVPYKHEVLGQWVSDQRRYYKKSKLCDDRITKMNSIGFVWNALRGPQKCNVNASSTNAQVTSKPDRNRKKRTDCPVISSPSPKRRKSERPRNLHDEQNNIIAGEREINQEETALEPLESEDEELEEEDHNKDKDNTLSSTVNKLSTAQLQRIASILQISHPSAVANAVALVNPT